MASRTFFLTSALLLAACGGNDNSHSIDSGSVAYYSTYAFRDSRLLALVVFEGGLAYGFYQSDYSSSGLPGYAYAGFFIGRTASPGDPGAPYDGTDFDFAGRGALPTTFTLDVQPLRGVTGTITDAGRPADNFAAIYSQTATMPSRSRTLTEYVGYVRSTGGGMAIQASLTADGQLTASSSSGCTLSGILAARPLGNLADA